MKFELGQYPKLRLDIAIEIAARLYSLLEDAGASEEILMAAHEWRSSTDDLSNMLRREQLRRRQP